MSSLSSFVACEPIQTGIAQMFFGQTNIKSYTDANILRYLLSSTNTDLVMKRTIAPDGKLRTVRVVYSQRLVQGESESGSLIGCEDGEIMGETSKDYTINPDEGYKKSVRISPELMRTRCEADSLYMARKVKELMDLVIADTERSVAEKIALNLGNFATDVDNGDAPGTTSEKTFSAKSSTGVILTDAYETISYDSMANQDGRPVVFGSQPWWNYAKSIEASCCNENGIDAGLYASNNPYLFALSIEASEALGDPNAAFSLSPGAVQFLYANEFENPLLRVEEGSLIMGTMLYPDPDLPILFDYKAKLDDCAKEWVITVSLNSDLAFLPEDMYKAEDRLFGTNGIRKYVIENCYVPCTTPNP